MEQLFLNWKGPFGIKEPIPYELREWVGLYIIEYDSARAKMNTSEE